MDKDEKRKKSHRGWLVACVVLALIVLVLAFTCPPAEKHQKALAKEVNTAIGNVATKDYGLLGAFGSMLASGVVNVAVEEFLNVDDYIVCSVGKLYYGGDTTVVSVGVLNHIFTIHSDKIEEKLHDIQNSFPFGE